MVYHDTDYTMQALIAISVIVLFALQYFLCAKAKSGILRQLPLAYVALILLLAGLVLVSDAHNSFLDLRALIAILLGVYAAICAAAILAARLVYRFKNRKK